MAINVTKKHFDKIINISIKPQDCSAVQFSWYTKRLGNEVYNTINRNPIEEYDIHKVNPDSYQTGLYFVPDYEKGLVWVKYYYLAGHNKRDSIRNNHVCWVETSSKYMTCVDNTHHCYMVDTFNDKVQAKPITNIYSAKIPMQKASVIREIFAKLFKTDAFHTKYCIVQNSDIACLNYVFFDFLRTKGGKMSNKTQELISSYNKVFGDSPKSLCDFTNFIMNKTYSQNIRHTILLDSADNKLILRRFDGNIECSREFWDDKNNSIFMSYINNAWVKTKKTYNYWNYNFILNKDCQYNSKYKYLFKYINEAQTDFIENKIQLLRTKGVYHYNSTRNMFELSYEDKDIMSHLKNTVNSNVNNLCTTLMDSPVLEKLLSISDQEGRFAFYQNPNIANIYGTLNSKTGSMFQQIGLNQYQINHPQNAPFAKTILHRTDLRDIDNATWDLINSLPVVFCGDYKIKSILEKLSTHNFSWQKAKKFIEFIKQLRDPSDTYIYWRPDSPVSIYLDYLNMLDDIHMINPDIEYPFWLYDTHSILRYHDELINIYHLYQKEASEAKWKDLYDKIYKKYYYEDKTYMIRGPKSAQELVDEGAVQHICIGGYTKSVENNSTKIFLIRKSEHADKPFYAMEINNHGCVRQIHGLYNSWLCHSEDGQSALPTICDWLIKHKFYIRDKRVLLSMANSYGCVNPEMYTPDQETMAKITSLIKT